MPDFGSWTPKALGPYAWYDAHLGGYATGIRDTSAYGRPDATLGAGSNAPAWLPWPGEPSYQNSMTAGNKLSASFSVSHRFGATGSIEGIMAEPITTLATQYQIGGNATSGAGGGGAALRLNSFGAPYLTYHNGTAFATVTCPVVVTIGTRKVKADWSGGVCSFYIAHGVSDPWTLLGVAAMATNPNSAGGALEFSVGSNNGSDNMCPFGIARVAASVNGSTVLDFEAEKCGQTGYTDAFGNVWTVSRPTAGRKATVQSPVANSTRGLYLLGTDDFIAIPGAALPPMLASSNNTFVVVARMWNTPVSFGRIFSTQPTSASADRGVYIMSSSATSVQGRYADGTTLNGVGSNNFRNGLREVWGLVAWASGQSFTLYQSEQNLGTVSLASVGDRSSAGARIGSNLNGTSFSDLEFEALLTFDRGLTTAEVAQLNAYYRGGL